MTSPQEPISLDFSGVDTTELAPKAYFEIWREYTKLFSQKELESLMREEIDPEGERGIVFRKIRLQQLATLGDMALEDKIGQLEEDRGDIRLIVSLDVAGFYQGVRLGDIEDTED